MAAEASRTIAGAASSDLAEVARLGQVLGDSPTKMSGRATASGLHPRPRVEVPIVPRRFGEQHDSLGRVVKVSGHKLRISGTA